LNQQPPVTGGRSLLLILIVSEIRTENILSTHTFLRRPWIVDIAVTSGFNDVFVGVKCWFLLGDWRTLASTACCRGIRRRMRQLDHFAVRLLHALVAGRGRYNVSVSLTLQTITCCCHRNSINRTCAESCKCVRAGTFST
jgi:hypothetical protein